LTTDIAVATRAARASTPWRAPGFLARGDYHNGSVLANRLGLQIARAVAMNADFALRRRVVDRGLEGYVAEYDRNGVVAIPEFLSPDIFATVREEAQAAYEAGLFKAEVVEDNSVVEEALTIGKEPERFPATKQYVEDNHRLRRLAAATLRLPDVGGVAVEVSYMHKSADAPRPKKLVGTNYIHADVHYPSVKAWLFLEDIDERNGAFVYARGTHRLTWARLVYEYEASVRVAKAKREKGFRKTVPYGLLRMPTERQMQAMGIEETVLSGPANTLVLASTMGFHRRGEFADGHRREQIQVKFSDRPKS
jgi:Phytanoyl-CoA dioxygenase (PhyH)